jgi:hypothetical protein
MRKLVVLFAALSLVVFGVVILNAGEGEDPTTAAVSQTPWFDLENCGMCKHLTSVEGLMDHLTWENHNIPTGMMAVTVVDEGWEDKYESVAKKMEQTGAELMQGKQIPMCGMCRSMGKIFMTGKAQYEEVKTVAGYVAVLTSTDSEVINMIHDHTNRTNEEWQKIEALEESHAE